MVTIVFFVKVSPPTTVVHTSTVTANSDCDNEVASLLDEKKERLMLFLSS